MSGKDRELPEAGRCWTRCGMLTGPALRKTEAEDGSLRPTLASFPFQPSFRRASVLTITRRKGFLIPHSVMMRKHANATEGRITSQCALPGMRHTLLRRETDGATRGTRQEGQAVDQSITNGSNFSLQRPHPHLALSIVLLRYPVALLGQWDYCTLLPP